MKRKFPTLRAFLRKAFAFTLLMLTLSFANSENLRPPRNGKKNKAYDGVGLEVVPKPKKPRKRKEPRVVLTTRGAHLHFDLEEPYSQLKYTVYLKRASQRYQSSRWERIKDAIRRQIARQTRKFARRVVRKEFREGPQMDQEEYREKLREIEKIGREREPRWRIQYDETDPVLADKYEREWDESDLIVWGPLVVTDSGAVNFDLDLENFKRLWKVDLEDIEIAPPPPDDSPPPLLGQKVKFHTNVNVRVSSSRVLKPLMKGKIDTLPQELLSFIRYLRVRVGMDLYTDITKKRYFGSEVEVRLYKDLSWAAFLNVIIEGH